jgi:transposase
VVERTFGWLGRHRRLARDDERLAQTLSGDHWLAYLGIMIQRIFIDSA